MEPAARASPSGGFARPLTSCSPCDWRRIAACAQLSAVDGMQANAAMGRNIKMALRGLGVAMVPLTASFPQGVFVYWISTNLYSLGQTLGALRRLRAPSALCTHASAFITRCSLACAAPRSRLQF